MSIFILLIFSSALGSFSIPESEDNEKSLKRCRAFGDFGAKVEILEKEECQVIFNCLVYLGNSRTSRISKDRCQGF